MIKSNFSKYFTDKDALDSISVTEIESLIAEAPSSDLYRLLLANKLNGMHLHDAALTSSDRLLLEDIIYNRVQETAVVPPPKNGSINHIVAVPIFQEEVLKDTPQKAITVVPEVLSEDTSTQKEEVVASTEIEEKLNTQATVVEYIADPKVEQEIQDRPSAPDDYHQENDTLQDLEQVASGSKNSKVKKATKHKKKNKYALDEYSGLTPYALWLLSFEKDDLDKRLKKEAKRAEKHQLEATVLKSVTKSNEIISESLAQILENQGHLDDAKKMYEQLMHKYPEKSRYFAAKIDNLIKS
ncbi:MAG: hypothetical protein LC107_06740 [Chitinophagales bacterium]|nr:hypothetical protein [Chitinophagales bacterium]